MLFKVLNEDGSVCHHYDIFRWKLPVKNKDDIWTVGKWMSPIEGKLKECRNGYHLCTLELLLRWSGPAIFIAEYQGERLDTRESVIVRKPRLLWRVEAWNARIARLFMCDCAEHILPIFEKRAGHSDSLRQAIGIARQFANDEATEKERGQTEKIVKKTRATVAHAHRRGYSDWRAIPWIEVCDVVTDALALDITRHPAAHTAFRAIWACGGIDFRAERDWQIARLRHYLKL